MTKKYFIWKNPECNGVKPEWIELSGEEFYKFINTPQNSGRKFIKEYFYTEDDSGYCQFEVSKEKYREWKTMQKRIERSEDVLIADYKKYRLLEKDNVDIKKVNSIPYIVSFDEPLDENEETTYHDIVPDIDLGYIEAEKAMLIKRVMQIIRTLTMEEQKLIDNLFFYNPNNLSDNEIARQMNIPTTTFNRKKLNILKKISEKVG